MRHTLKIPALSLVLFGWMNAAQAQDDAPKSFRIQNIRSNGTGCPLGTVTVNVSDDQQAFTLTFNEFYAEVSPAVGRTQERKTCRVVFDTEQDAGWEYAILAVTYRGFADLDEGVSGEQNLRFGGLAKQSETTLSLTGPYEDNYVNTQEVPLNALKWSGCKDNKQKDFTVDGTIALRAPNNTAEGLFTVDSIDGEIRQEYEVLWRDCKDTKKTYAICRLSIPAKKGSKQLLTKGMAKNDNQALSKAKAKMAKKCDKDNKHSAGCDANKAVCSTVNL